MQEMGYTFVTVAQYVNLIRKTGRTGSGSPSDRPIAVLTMKQSLDLKLGQHLTITPQLQQAIRLLQLSSLELQQEIQEALENNPLLEETEDEGAAREEPEPGPVAETNESSGDEDGDSTDTSMSGEEIAVDRDAAIDDDSFREEYSQSEDWEEGYEARTATTTRNDAEDGPSDLDARNSAPTTLREHLLWQMQMTPFSPGDRRIAEALIDAISEDGYLSCGFEEIQQVLGEPAVEADEIQAVLHQIQNFDPAGVAARDLAECLQLQLRHLDPDIPHLDEARQLATSTNLGLLAGRDFKQLKRLTRLAPEDLQAAVQLIQQLNPRPGASIASAHAGYIAPDITVKKVRGVWRAELTSSATPRLAINREYERLIRRGTDSSENKYLQDKLQEARWFIKSLTSRNDTLLKVARAIVDRQRAFFEHGPEAMKPLVLHDIAEIVGMHESTISRVTTSKYMLTPRGIFELKYFFSSHVATADGGTCSATAIRSLIKKLVEAEKPEKPISDSTIADILAAQGIHVARRTVAKYREALNIPPSSQRKSLV
jgi:RNA polymerase sigma-54 factor